MKLSYGICFGILLIGLVELRVKPYPHLVDYELERMGTVVSGKRQHAASSFLAASIIACVSAVALYALAQRQSSAPIKRSTIKEDKN